MDAEAEPVTGRLCLEEGEAHVIRNAGLRCHR